MHDRPNTYVVVFDDDKEPSDSACRTHGSFLLMTDWTSLIADPAQYGVSRPVLVKQFIAHSWEQAMQNWYDMRGLGFYQVTCQSRDHRGDPKVPWVNDQALCVACSIQGEIGKLLAPHLGKAWNRQARDEIKMKIKGLLIKQMYRQLIRSYTVSSEQSVLIVTFTDKQGQSFKLQAAFA